MRDDSAISIGIEAIYVLAFPGTYAEKAAAKGDIEGVEIAQDALRIRGLIPLGVSKQLREKVAVAMEVAIPNSSQGRR